MDLYNAIRQLTDEKTRLDQVIQSLETFLLTEQPAKAVKPAARSPRSTRGRKHMTESEREVVSERMRRYWAARRAAKAAVPGNAVEEPEA